MYPRTFRFLRAVRTHLTTARYVLLAALSAKKLSQHAHQVAAVAQAALGHLALGREAVHQAGQQLAELLGHVGRGGLAGFAYDDARAGELFAASAVREALQAFSSGDSTANAVVSAVVNVR